MFLFLRALLAFLVLPGCAAFLLPPLIAHYDPWRGDGWWPGAGVMLLGSVILLWCVRDFYHAGKGTLAPWDPPKKFVVIGLYRFVRNPMYIGVLLVVLGWAVFFVSWLVLAYAVGLFAAFHFRVIWHEEPWLESQFPEEWREYLKQVARWMPRLWFKRPVD